MAERDEKSEPTPQDQLEAEIAQKRLELAQTLDQLGTKLDVKKQVGDRVETRHLAVAGAVVVAMVVLVVWRRRR